jgi:hypothetical protein
MQTGAELADTVSCSLQQHLAATATQQLRSMLAQHSAASMPNQACLEAQDTLLLLLPAFLLLLLLLLLQVCPCPSCWVGSAAAAQGCP